MLTDLVPDEIPLPGLQMAYLLLAVFSHGGERERAGLSSYTVTNPIMGSSTS